MAITTSRTIRQEDKFNLTPTGEPMNVTDYSDIPLCIIWEASLRGSEALAHGLEAIGFEMHRSKHTTITQMPTGWTEYIDLDNNIRLLDEVGVLRAIIKYVAASRTLEFDFFTRLECGYNPRSKRHYIYDRQSGKTLKRCKSQKRMQKWIKRHYPEYTDPTAYRGCPLTPSRW